MDLNFIGGRNLKEELQNLDEKVGAFESLNLFGVDISSDQALAGTEKKNKGASKQEVQRVL